MSKSSDGEFDLELHFLPAWAQQPPRENRYADYAGERERSGERRGERPRPPGRRDERRQPREKPPHGAAPGRFQPKRPFQRGDQPGPRRPEPAGPPLPELNAAFKPEEKGVDSLAKQIKMTGRAYPLFDIAQMILRKPERHTITLSVKKSAEGQPIQPLYLCALDQSLWLSEEEATRWTLEKHFDAFYKAERVQTEAPKGTYTFVAQCGMSGLILGPPNYHDYQNQLRKLHSERFSRMPFEVFKSRVKIVRDEGVVKKWIDEQSWKTTYVCLNLPEPLTLQTREEVEKHFREVHLPNVVTPVESTHLTGTAGRDLRSAPLRHLVRHAWEGQRRFPLQIATVLSQQFTARGLQFFKVNKTVTHVAVARPHYLDLEATPVSDGVKRIVDFIHTHVKCTRRQLFEALAPGSVLALPPTKGEAEPAPQQLPEPTPELTAVIADLHWLIHQGHVIEFANGILDLAKKPVLKPPRPAPAPSAPKEPNAIKPATPASEAPSEPQVEPTELSAEPTSQSPAETPEGGFRSAEHDAAMPAESTEQPSQGADPMPRVESEDAELESGAGEASQKEERSDEVQPGGEHPREP